MTTSKLHRRAGSVAPCSLRARSRARRPRLGRKASLRLLAAPRALLPFAARGAVNPPRATADGCSAGGSGPRWRPSEMDAFVLTKPPCSTRASDGPSGQPTATLASFMPSYERGRGMRKVLNLHGPAFDEEREI